MSNTDQTEMAKKVMELAGKYREYTAENLSRLVKIPSVSMEEGEVMAELVKQMEEAGFDEVWTDPLGNVLGRIGNGKKVLAIDAHMDTVDVGNRENWEFDPFSGVIEDGHVLGRGTVDQEGGAASFVTAGRILKELGLENDVTLYCIGTVMEEDCDGLCWKYIVEEDKLKPDIVISTEPTNLNVYRGHRGRMEMGATFRGVSSHGSAPERGTNAVYMASKACLDVEKLHENLKVDPFLGKGSIAVTDFQSGSPSLCAIPDSARIHLDRRLTWGETKESAVAEIENIIKDMDARVEVLEYREKAYTGLEYGMEKYFPTWKIPEDHPAVVQGVEAFSDLFGRKPKVDKWTFSTNGVTINGDYKIPLIGFGPGNEVMAHAPNEKVPVEHLDHAAAFYAMYALKM